MKREFTNANRCGATSDIKNSCRYDLEVTMQGVLTFMLGNLHVCMHTNKCDFSSKIIITPLGSVTSNLHMNPILLKLLTLLITLSHLH